MSISLLALFFPCCILATLLGMQVEAAELKLLTGKYNYRPQKAQWITPLATLGTAALLVFDGMRHPMAGLFLASTALLLLICLEEWVLTRVNPSRRAVSWGLRLAAVAAGALATWGMSTAQTAGIPLFPFALMGLYLRNSPFGIPHGKDLCLAYRLRRQRKAGETNCHTPTRLADYGLPDFSFAGCGDIHEEDWEVFNVKDHGIVPNTGEDVAERVQSLINKVGQRGGGRIFFPAGKYLLNKTGGKFLRIDHSNICIEGETDAEGRPMAELISCAPTANGTKNPWLSPFIITTGEQLQASNEFFGLQFRKKRQGFQQSISLSDPGSDGNILTPAHCTDIIADARKGDCRLRVGDAGAVGKYIMLGMYNTTPDGNLIRDILGVGSLRAEWKTARRAGEEEAPSYQWLAEVKGIVDEHTIELARPLLRDVEMKYQPAIFNVTMLEHIVIRNLRLGSKWNGTFRHHGFPLYYTIESTQEMDYGWNGINMKRVAHGKIYNVVFQNLTNPLYVLDSRNVTVRNISTNGYDGHQGIKIYQHTCDCLFQDICFYNHYADMMGGEGNAYGNVFSRIDYLNPVFKPVDFDFHGFGEGPMSPPACNLFENVRGFRYIKAAGAIFNLPSCAQDNVWWNLETEGERNGDILFYAMPYRPKKGLLRLITAAGFAAATAQKTRQLSPKALWKTFKGKLESIDATGVPREGHGQFFPNSYVFGIQTTADLSPYAKDGKITVVNGHGKCAPCSLFEGH